MKVKTKIGMDMKPKKKMTRKKATKKQILPMAKRGGALPFLPMLSALLFLIGEAVSVTKVVNDSKVTSARRATSHDRTME